jgi:hypothetical protein
MSTADLECPALGTGQHCEQVPERANLLLARRLCVVAATPSVRLVGRSGNGKGMAPTVQEHASSANAMHHSTAFFVHPRRPIVSSLALVWDGTRMGLWSCYE